jgi:hypothetical protein
MSLTVDTSHVTCMSNVIDSHIADDTKIAAAACRIGYEIGL